MRLGVVTIKPVNFWHRNVRRLPKIVINAITTLSYVQYFGLPSEYVLMPGTSTPPLQQGRAFLHFRKVKENEYNHLIEVYEDWGDDGHIEYNLGGFAEITDAQYKEYLEAVNAAKSPWEFPQIDYTSFIDPI